ncbi:hypothetical protein HDV63DRAFT_377352 [Trichoderma sp. SZMC 28014]
MLCCGTSSRSNYMSLLLLALYSYCLELVKCLWVFWPLLCLTPFFFSSSRSAAKNVAEWLRRRKAPALALAPDHFFILFDSLGYIIPFFGYLCLLPTGRSFPFLFNVKC